MEPPRSISIPAAPQSPHTLQPQSPGARPPTPGGGPLSSHPATPGDSRRVSPSPGLRQPSTPPQRQIGSPTQQRGRVDSAQQQRKPLSPASPNTQPVPRRRDSTGVRKLLSISSLRNSFVGNRSSVHVQSSPPSQQHEPSYFTHISGGSQNKPPTSPSLYSQTTNGSTYQTYQAHVTTGSPRQQQSPPLRKRRSGAWYRRKSGLFMFDGMEDIQGQQSTLEPQQPLQPQQQQPQPLSSSGESNGSRPETATRSSRPPTQQEQTPRLYQGPAAPQLPQIGALTDGSFADTDIFASIGRA